MDYEQVNARNKPKTLNECKINIPSALKMNSYFRELGVLKCPKPFRY